MRRRGTGSWHFCFFRVDQGALQVVVHAGGKIWIAFYAHDRERLGGDTRSTVNKSQPAHLLLIYFLEFLLLVLLLLIPRGVLFV